jgi:MFS family permease
MRETAAGTEPMSNIELQQVSEFRRGWPVLIASFIGIMVGLTGLPFYSYGVFAGSLEAEFGWSRSQTQLPLLFQTIGALTVMPFIGWTCDKFGARPVALLSMILYGFSFAMLSLLGPSIWQYYGTVLIIGLVGAGTTPITWTRAINGAFQRNRGIALGAALMGTGFIGFIAPRLAAHIIEEHGWRTAMLALSGFPLLIGVPVVALLFKERTEHGEVAQEMQIGKTLFEALRDYRFALIAGAFMVISFGIGGSIPNLFPLYVGVGFSASDAAGILSMVGLSVIIGRVATGFLLDRFWAPGVATALMCMPAISCFLLISDSISYIEAVVATVLIGLAAGAEFDIIAYLASRYFGMKSYSKIYSLLYMAFSIGAAVAPGLFGFAFDESGSYNFILIISAGLFLLGGIALLGLGRYPKFTTPAPAGEETHPRPASAPASIP